MQIKFQKIRNAETPVYCWDTLAEFFENYNSEEGFHCIDVELNDIKLPLYFFIRIKRHCPLVVFYHGANHRERMQLPRIDGVGITADMNCSLFSPCDPLLFINEKMVLTWYTAFKDDPLKLILSIAKHLKYALNSTRLIYCGSSGGGFAALRSVLYYCDKANITPYDTDQNNDCFYSSLDNFNYGSTAIAINPQTDIKSFYWDPVVKAFFELDANEKSPTQSGRPFSLLNFKLVPEFLNSSKSQIYYLQQNEDIHIEGHLIPFLKTNDIPCQEAIDGRLSTWISDDVYLHIGNWKQNISMKRIENHVRPPKKFLYYVLQQLVSDNPIDRNTLRGYDCIPPKP